MASIRWTLAAVVLTLSWAGAAQAQSDDLVTACQQAGKPGDAGQEKVCKCMSEKITDDRPAVIKMIRTVNEAAAKGGDPDVSKMTPDEQKTFAKVMETFATCFQ
jgi:hypothetical protein